MDDFFILDWNQIVFSLLSIDPDLALLKSYVLPIDFIGMIPEDPADMDLTKFI